VPVGGMRRPGFVLHFGQDRHSRRDQDVGIGDGFRGKSDDSVPEPALTVDLVTIGGPPELGHLFIDVPADMIAGALEAWEWIGLDGLTTIAVSAFGEPFFRDTQGAIHQLDTLDGKLNAVAGSLSEFTAILQEEAARDELLLAGLVLGAIGRGLILAPGECYDFKIAPILGGEISADQIETMSFLVKLHIAGQLHDQVRHLAPGTKINSVTLEP
jgi:hypothetical protein